MAVIGTFGKLEFQRLKLSKTRTPPKPTETAIAIPSASAEGSLDFSNADQSGLLVLLLEDF